MRWMDVYLEADRLDEDSDPEDVDVTDGPCATSPARAGVLAVSCGVPQTAAVHKGTRPRLRLAPACICRAASVALLPPRPSRTRPGDCARTPIADAVTTILQQHPLFGHLPVPVLASVQESFEMVPIKKKRPVGLRPGGARVGLRCEGSLLSGQAEPFTGVRSDPPPPEPQADHQVR